MGLRGSGVRKLGVAQTRTSSSGTAYSPTHVEPLRVASAGAPNCQRGDVLAAIEAAHPARVLQVLHVERSSPWWPRNRSVPRCGATDFSVVTAVHGLLARPQHGVHRVAADNVSFAVCAIGGGPWRMASAFRQAGFLPSLRVSPLSLMSSSRQRASQRSHEELPPFPEGWYFVGERRSIERAKLIEKTWMGEEIVAWADEEGRICVADAGLTPFWWTVESGGSLFRGQPPRVGSACCAEGVAAWEGDPGNHAASPRPRASKATGDS